MMKKKINIIIVVLLILNALIIYFSFVGIRKKAQEINISQGNSIAKKITVEYEAYGNPLSKVEINDITDKDSKINNVPMVIGGTFDISGNFSNLQLKEANVTIEYDETKMPEDISEDDLGILWYDESKDMMVEMESQVNKADKKISFKTTHFSQYAFVNITKWHEVWAKQVAKIREANSNYSVSFIIDDSGSMTQNDPKNKRIDATKEAISTISDEDRYNIIQFSDKSSELQEFTSDKDAADDDYDEFKSYGGTDIVGAVQKGIELLKQESSKRDKIIILLTDGEDSSLARKKDDLIHEANDNGIIIFGIGLEANSNSNLDFSPVSDMAVGTTGKFYRINDSGLTEIFTEVTNATVGIDGTIDTDGDGIPDGLETAGMRDQYGNIIKTDPNLADTDGDGKSDGEEMGKRLTDSNGNIYYERISDPNVNESEDGSTVIKKRDYELGPSKDADSSNVWDSGFRKNVNALKMRNFKVDFDGGGYGFGSGGLCNGFGNFTEGVYNGTLPIKTDKWPRLLTTLHGYDLSAERYSKVIKNKQLYSFTPTSEKLKQLTSRNIQSPTIYTSDMNNDPDGELIKMLFYYQLIQFDLDDAFGKTFKNKDIDENEINIFKKYFRDGKIVTIDIPNHTINAYALEKMSDTCYKLYVYDSNTPYEPESLPQRGHYLVQRNNAIFLFKQSKKTLTGTTKEYYMAGYMMQIYLKEDIDPNIDLTTLTEEDYWNDFASEKYEYIDNGYFANGKNKFKKYCIDEMEISVEDRCINE